VVRFSNKHCICQIVYSEVEGDKVMAYANSAELPRYGLTAGLKNYAAAYCTGLLVARRLLQKLKLDDVYKGNLTYEDEDNDEDYTPTVVKTTIGEKKGEKKRTYYVDELDDDKNPFHAILDVGIITTSTGSRLFGALKGATDGGLDIPHSEKRFPGYDRDAKKYDADVHKERIFGEHVAEYMRYLIEEDATKYKTHFKEYLKEDLDADSLEEKYQDVHKKIREDPAPKPSQGYTGDRVTFKKLVKKTFEKRKIDVEAKRSKFEADDEEEAEEADDAE
jgi:large subunit ribosomal protein L5e